MTRLALTLPLTPYETQTSYVSRLAARNGCASAYEFCHDVGLDWRAVINGESHELARLADISGENAGRLISQAIRVVGRRRLATRYAVVSDKVLERTQVRLCPICARGAEHGEVPFSAIQVVQNVVAPVVTCPWHKLPLIILPRARFAIDNFDVTAVARKHRQMLELPQIALSTARPAAVETYMLERLVDGRATCDCLDKLPAHVIARASEVIGLRANLGADTALSGHDSSVLNHARAVGFDVLQGGPDVLAHWLETTCISNEGRRRRYGKDLGPINTWLTDSRLHPDYFPLRKVFAEFVIRNYAVTAGAKILGEIVATPKLLPTRHFARAVGVSTSFIRDVISSGLAPPPPSELADLFYLSLVTAEQANAVRKINGNVIEPIEAREMLGCSEGTFASILKAGLVRPLQGSPAHLRWFSRSDVVDLLTRVRELPVVKQAHRDAVPLAAAAQASKCSIGELLGMLMRGEIRMARSRRDGPPVSSIVLARPAVSAICPSYDGRGILRSDAAKTLGVSVRTIARLLRLGRLEPLEERHPMTGEAFVTVQKESLEAFRARYIAIALAGDEIGESFQAVQSAVDRLNISLLSAGRRGARFLHRRDLPRIVDDLHVREINGKRRRRKAGAPIAG